MAREIYNYTDSKNEIYIYYRSGTKHYTPCLSIAITRKDVDTDIEILG